MRIVLEESVFIMIDVQEKFENIIYEMEDVVKNCRILNKTTEILSVPLIITEQYPRGLGETLSVLKEQKNAITFIKMTFSVFTNEVEEKIKSLNKKTLILYGVEAHVCVMQSALEAKEKGYNVVVVCDAVSSRTKQNKEIAVNRFVNNNIECVSTEMLIFELLQTAENDNFKKLSKLIK